MIRTFILGLVLSIFIAGPSATAAEKGRPMVLPPGEPGAKAALEKSPRHQEWIDIAVPGAQQKMKAFIVYPERKDKAPTVILIHEVFGLTDWMRSVADRLAAEGFIVIAPDMLTGKGPDGKGTDGFASRDDVVKAVRDIQTDDVMRMVEAVRTYVKTIPAATGKIATVGFCWGGGQSFSYAATQPDLGAAVVYYGTSPQVSELKNIRAPVLGLYGEDDARVTSTVQPAAQAMKAMGKTFVTHIFKGAGHGFLRAQDERNGANMEASRKAWPITIEFLKKNLK